MRAAVLAILLTAGAFVVPAGAQSDDSNSGTYNGRVMNQSEEFAPGESLELVQSPTIDDYGQFSIELTCTGATCVVTNFSKNVLEMTLTRTSGSEYSVEGLYDASTRPPDGDCDLPRPMTGTATLANGRLEFVVKAPSVRSTLYGYPGSDCVAFGFTWTMEATRADAAREDPTTSVSSQGAVTASPTPGTGLPPGRSEASAAATSGRRSAVAASLQTPADAAGGGLRHFIENVLLAGLLVILLVFPSQLFNNTFEEHEDRIRRRLARFMRRPDRDIAPAQPIATRGRGFGWFAAVTIAGGVIGLFLDPGVGFRVATVALLIGGVASTMLGAVIGLGGGHGFRRVGGLPTQTWLRTVPLGLVIAALCVVISRATHFQPGYLFGLVGGWVFTSELSERDSGRSQLVSTAITLALAGLAWWAFVPVAAAANRPGASAFVIVADVVLAALVIGGIEGTLFGLAPMKFMPGHSLAAWSWWVWSAVAMAVSVAFVQVLLRPATGYLGGSTSASVTVTVGLFVAFGLGSVVFWSYFRFNPSPERPLAATGAPPPAPSPSSPVSVTPPPYCPDDPHLT